MDKTNKTNKINMDLNFVITEITTQIGTIGTGVGIVLVAIVPLILGFIAFRWLTKASKRG